MPEHVFIIGGQRCATTYLYSLLEAQPDIEMAKPVRPEPKYFLTDQKEPRTAAQYAQTYFTQDTPIRGEKSTSYSDSDAALANILKMFPKARFIMVLRDPIERAISNVKFSRDNGFETAPLEAALMRELTETGAGYSVPGVSVSPFAYLERSFYRDRLEQIAQIIPHGQLYVEQTERLTASHDARRAVLRFAGASEEDASAGSGHMPPVNAAVGAHTDAAAHLSPSVLDRLRQHFAPMVSDMQRLYGCDPALWTTTYPDILS